MTALSAYQESIFELRRKIKTQGAKLRAKQRKDTMKSGARINLSAKNSHYLATGLGLDRRIVFARIGYMKFYNGPQPGDEKPKHGGAYTKDRIGHEVFNFKPVAGRVFGYFQASLHRKSDKPNTLNLGRIDPCARVKDSMEDVLVVFVARSDAKGQVIIGWYDKATVYRHYHKPTQEMQRDQYTYLLCADLNDAILLPEPYRKHSIPSGRGAFGQANIVYPHNINGAVRDYDSGPYRWIGKALSFIDSYDGPNLLSTSFDDHEEKYKKKVESAKDERSSQGFCVSAEQRKQIEQFAVTRATKHFEALGYKVKDVGRTKSYDLECRKLEEVLRVEVKGTQTDGTSVILTHNEVASARKHVTALFLLHSIKWLRIAKSTVPTGGHPFVLNPWHLDTHGFLAPLSYMYEIKGPQ